MSKNCVINLANNTNWYKKGQERLIESLKIHFNDDVLIYGSESDVNAPSHKNNPYAFKPYCFYDAMKKGYENVLWLDSSVYAVKNISPIFDILDNEGYFMLNSGHYTNTWCNDNCLKYFNTTKDDLSGQLMFMAGLFGLNLREKVCIDFLEEWKKSADCGAFIGSWTDHRHDMTCGSIISNKLGMKHKIADDYSSYIGQAFGTPKETSFFYLQGM